MARGFSQVERLDYGETFSHVIKITSLHILIALASIYDYHTHQMDIQTTFLMVTSMKKFLCNNHQVM